ncbi:hypothetical protein K6168_14645 [Streptomyces sp. FB2]|uniref:hypothetical protein n=1 Tax=Streptomyces sp. FB2 TaxID=2902454 RepID=UPI001F363EF0|nr:hypothetical protein [Streptomyces sp. FB2]MCF2536894.1 hypothetical protein [Streptomyces sp. FB2]
MLSPENPEAFWKLDYQEQKTTLENSHPGVPHTLQAFARLPGNKVVRSKNMVSLGRADAMRPTMRERWEGFRGAGIFGMAYRPGYDGQPHKFQVLATGPRSARDLVVDVVRDFGQGQQPLPDGAYTSIKRKRLRKKTLQVAVPQAAYGQNLYFRVSWKSGGTRQEFRAGIPERQDLDSAAAELRNRRRDVEES